MLSTCVQGWWRREEEDDAAGELRVRCGSSRWKDVEMRQSQHAQQLRRGDQGDDDGNDDGSDDRGDEDAEEEEDEDASDSASESDDEMEMAQGASLQQQQQQQQQQDQSRLWRTRAFSRSRARSRSHAFSFSHAWWPLILARFPFVPIGEWYRIQSAQPSSPFASLPPRSCAYLHTLRLHHLLLAAAHQLARSPLPSHADTSAIYWLVETLVSRDPTVLHLPLSSISCLLFLCFTVIDAAHRASAAASSSATASTSMTSDMSCSPPLPPCSPSFLQRVDAWLITFTRIVSETSSSASSTLSALRLRTMLLPDAESCTCPRAEPSPAPPVVLSSPSSPPSSSVPSPPATTCPFTMPACFSHDSVVFSSCAIDLHALFVSMRQHTRLIPSDPSHAFTATTTTTTAVPPSFPSTNPSSDSSPPSPALLLSRWALCLDLLCMSTRPSSGSSSTHSGHSSGGSGFLSQRRPQPQPQSRPQPHPLPHPVQSPSSAFNGSTHMTIAAHLPALPSTTFFAQVDTTKLASNIRAQLDHLSSSRSTNTPTLSIASTFLDCLLATEQSHTHTSQASLASILLAWTRIASRASHASVPDIHTATALLARSIVHALPASVDPVAAVLVNVRSALRRIERELASPVADALRAVASTPAVKYDVSTGSGAAPFSDPSASSSSGQLSLARIRAICEACIYVVLDHQLSPPLSVQSAESTSSVRRPAITSTTLHAQTLLDRCVLHIDALLNDVGVLLVAASASASASASSSASTSSTSRSVSSSRAALGYRLRQFCIGTSRSLLTSLFPPTSFQVAHADALAHVLRKPSRSVSPYLLASFFKLTKRLLVSWCLHSTPPNPPAYYARRLPARVSPSLSASTLSRTEECSSADSIAHALWRPESQRALVTSIFSPRQRAILLAKLAHNVFCACHAIRAQSRLHLLCLLRSHPHGGTSSNRLRSSAQAFNAQTSMNEHPASRLLYLAVSDSQVSLASVLDLVLCAAHTSQDPVECARLSVSCTLDFCSSLLSPCGSSSVGSMASSLLSSSSSSSSPSSSISSSLATIPPPTFSPLPPSVSTATSSPYVRTRPGGVSPILSTAATSMLAQHRVSSLSAASSSASTSTPATTISHHALTSTVSRWFLAILQRNQPLSFVVLSGAIDLLFHDHVPLFTPVIDALQSWQRTHSMSAWAHAWSNPAPAQFIERLHAHLAGYLPPSVPQQHDASSSPSAVAPPPALSASPPASSNIDAHTMFIALVLLVRRLTVSLPILRSMFAPPGLSKSASDAAYASVPPFPPPFPLVSAAAAAPTATSSADNESDAWWVHATTSRWLQLVEDYVRDPRSCLRRVVALQHSPAWDALFLFSPSHNAASHATRTLLPLVTNVLREVHSRDRLADADDSARVDACVGIGASSSSASAVMTSRRATAFTFLLNDIVAARIRHAPLLACLLAPPCTEMYILFSEPEVAWSAQFDSQQSACFSPSASPSPSASAFASASAAPSLSPSPSPQFPFPWHVPSHPLPTSLSSKNSTISARSQAAAGAAAAPPPPPPVVARSEHFSSQRFARFLALSLHTASVGERSAYSMYPPNHSALFRALFRFFSFADPLVCQHALSVMHDFASALSTFALARTFSEWFVRCVEQEPFARLTLGATGAGAGASDEQSECAVVLWRRSVCLGFELCDLLNVDLDDVFDEPFCDRVVAAVWSTSQSANAGDVRDGGLMFARPYPVNPAARAAEDDACDAHTSCLHPSELVEIVRYVLTSCPRLLSRSARLTQLLHWLLGFSAARGVPQSSLLRRFRLSPAQNAEFLLHSSSDAFAVGESASRCTCSLVEWYRCRQRYFVGRLANAAEAWDDHSGTTSVLPSCWNTPDSVEPSRACSSASLCGSRAFPSFSRWMRWELLRSLSMSDSGSADSGSADSGSDSVSGSSRVSSAHAAEYERLLRLLHENVFAVAAPVADTVSELLVQMSDTVASVRSVVHGLRTHMFVPHSILQFFVYVSALQSSLGAVAGRGNGLDDAVSSRRVDSSCAALMDAMGWPACCAVVDMSMSLREVDGVRPQSVEEAEERDDVRTAGEPPVSLTGPSLPSATTAPNLFLLASTVDPAQVRESVRSSMRGSAVSISHVPSGIARRDGASLVSSSTPAGGGTAAVVALATTVGASAWPGLISLPAPPPFLDTRLNRKRSASNVAVHVQQSIAPARKRRAGDEGANAVGSEEINSEDGDDQSMFELPSSMGTSLRVASVDAVVPVAELRRKNRRVIKLAFSSLFVRHD